MNFPVEYSSIKAGINSIIKGLNKYYKNKNIRIIFLVREEIYVSQTKVFANKYRKSWINLYLIKLIDISGRILY